MPRRGCSGESKDRIGDLEGEEIPTKMSPALLEIENSNPRLFSILLLFTKITGRKTLQMSHDCMEGEESKGIELK
jgi:hypothetical protein